jgi:CheY-like chemotaxis protein
MGVSQSQLVRPARSVGRPVAPVKPASVRRLLLVDDESTFRLALRHYLERRGWQVDEAPDGMAALQRLLVLADAEAYTAVLCDLNMPGMSGQGLHAQLVALESPAVGKLVFSTGDTFDPDVVAFLEATGGRWFQKPFELKRLAELLEVMNGSAAESLTA